MSTPADGPGPLDADGLRRVLCAPAGGWSRIEVVARTGSTNADLLAAAAAGPEVAPDRTVLVAEHQASGRGRRDRVWESRPGEGLTVSVLLRPAPVPTPRWGWLPLLAGLALARAVDDLGVPAGLKWPNDLLLGHEQAKGAGILAEMGAGGPGSDGPALVVGIGANVATPLADLPPGATSLAALGAEVAREALLAGLLGRLADLDDAWRAAGGDPVASGLAAGYRARCTTLGREVRVLMPGDRELTGTAVDLDREGRLVVRDTSGDTTAVSAGDVVHVRPPAR